MMQTSHTSTIYSVALSDTSLQYDEHRHCSLSRVNPTYSVCMSTTHWSTKSVFKIVPNDNSQQSESVKVFKSKLKIHLFALTFN